MHLIQEWLCFQQNASSNCSVNERSELKGQMNTYCEETGLYQSTGPVSHMQFG